MTLVQYSNHGHVFEWSVIQITIQITFFWYYIQITIQITFFWFYIQITIQITNLKTITRTPFINRWCTVIQTT